MWHITSTEPSTSLPVIICNLDLSKFHLKSCYCRSTLSLQSWPDYFHQYVIQTNCGPNQVVIPYTTEDFSASLLNGSLGLHILCTGLPRTQLWENWRSPLGIKDHRFLPEVGWCRVRQPVGHVGKDYGKLSSLSDSANEGNSLLSHQRVSSSSSCKLLGHHQGRRLHTIPVGNGTVY